MKLVPQQKQLRQSSASGGFTILSGQSLKNAFGKSSFVNAKITAIEPLTSSIKLVTMKITKGSVKFQAGQFIGVYDGRKQKGIDDTNSIFPGTYSIASAPKDLPYISFAIGEDHNPRNLRNFLFYHAKIGDQIKLDRNGCGTVAVTPSMVMTPVGGPGGLVLIGGGSAVMGLVSIVEQLLWDKRGRQIPFITLLHSNRSNEDIPFFERMKFLEKNFDQFNYQPFITGRLEDGQEAKGNLGRITPRDLANVIAGARLFCVCGSGVFCEAMVNSLLALGVWPGSIRTDYTTRVDSARQLAKLEIFTERTEDFSSSSSSSSSENLLDIKCFESVSKRTLRFEACADATQDKGAMVSAGDDYLETYGLNTLFDVLKRKLSEKKPDFPLQFLADEVENARKRLPEISNSKAGDPEFWINYYETDLVTWQAPVTSPWLVRHLSEFLGSDTKKRVFVPLCGKSLDLKLLLDAGHHVIGAECSGIACSDFFVENNIPDYDKEKVNHPTGARVVRHYSKSLPIEIYEGDVFELNAEVLGGQVDAVLDRAALVALPPSLIEDKYLPLITSLMADHAKMLFASVSELPFPKAPPHIYEDKMIEGLLRGFFSQIDLKEVHRYRVNAGHVSEPIYMLEGKLSS